MVLLFYLYQCLYYFSIEIFYKTAWRNGSASDSRSEGCVFESRRGQNILFLQKMDNFFLPFIQIITNKTKQMFSDLMNYF